MIKKVLAIIPARGGSKGLPRKNIINLSGKPLISWTIEASLKSKYITKTIVSSDDDEILDISKKCGAEIIKRPNSLSGDTSTSESVVEHVINHLLSRKEKFDILILLQPTSPLRTFQDIDMAFDIMNNSDSTALISGYKVDSKFLKILVEGDKGYIGGIMNNKYLFTRRQDLPKVYDSNGAIYIVKMKDFIKNKSFMSNKTVVYNMSKEKSLDIDTSEDLERASRLMTAISSAEE
jgi:CMP-N,N'-diacetyllegionaminic acid synthase